MSNCSIHGRIYVAEDGVGMFACEFIGGGEADW